MYFDIMRNETFRFSDVFRGYRKATPVCNGLTLYKNIVKNKKII